MLKKDKYSVFDSETSFKKAKKKSRISKRKTLQKVRQDPSFGTSMSYKIKNIK
jgi:hypothetical protein